MALAKLRLALDEMDETLREGNYLSIPASSWRKVMAAMKKVEKWEEAKNKAIVDLCSPVKAPS